MFSDPIVGDEFFGRADVLSLCSKRVNGLKDGYRQNIAIIGPKLIGKSSFILHFFSNFKHPAVLPIYIDLWPNSFKHFIYKFLGALLYQYLKNKNLTVSEDLDLLKGYARNSIPKTIEAVEEVERGVRDLQLEEAYEGLLRTTSVLKEETGLCCIVILDEFHLLDTYKIKEPFSSFAKEIMMQRDTMYILISSQISYAKGILANQLSLLFGNFETIHLRPFDYTTSCKFLEKRFRDISLPTSLRDFLIAFSEGHPFYLDILSKKIKEKSKEFNKGQISPSFFSRALNSLIYDSQGILNQYFTNLLSHNLNGADYSGFLPILLAASERGARLSDIAGSRDRQSRIISRQINYLLDKDLLSKVGVFYRIQDKIFRFWLRSVYQRKSLSLTADPATESRDFSKEIEEDIQNFSRETKKKLAERVVELFKSFRNEILMFQNKSFKFCHFEEVRSQPLGNSQECIVARYKDGYWLGLVKEEKASEVQIQEFHYYCRTSKYKIRRAIIISPEELELNARLLALEKKFWIWSLSDLNLLLDLYGKQQIVH